MEKVNTASISMSKNRKSRRKSRNRKLAQTAAPIASTPVVDTTASVGISSALSTDAGNSFEGVRCNDIHAQGSNSGSSPDIQISSSINLKKKKWKDLNVKTVAEGSSFQNFHPSKSSKRRRRSTSPKHFQYQNECNSTGNCYGKEKGELNALHGMCRIADFKVGRMHISKPNKIVIIAVVLFGQ
jgi:hypothetical protein